tara:strand:- start:440 stop:1849 length:1410 start_codon:yes stop_codon:yes gene_type:complete
MITQFDKNKIPKNIIILLCWLIILASINTLFRDITNIKNLEISFKIENFFIILNFLRYLLPILFLPFFLMIIKNRFSNFSKLLIFYGLAQVFALIIFRDINGILNNISYPILLFTLIIYFEVFKYDLDEKIFSSIFFVSIFFLTTIVLVFLPGLINKFLSTPGQTYLYWASIESLGGTMFLQAYPRVTGIARSLLIILFFLISFYLFKKSNKYKKLIFVVAIIVSTLIYSLQSRGALIGYLPMIIIIIFFLNLKIKVKFYTLIGIILVPIFLWESISFFKNDRLTKISTEFETQNNDEIIILKNFKIENNKKPGFKSRVFSERALNSSGRVQIWKKCIEIIKNKKIFLGYGPQADRYLIPVNEYFFYNGVKNALANNSSNGFIYAYMCAGIIGLICIVLFSLIISIKLIKILFFKSKKIQDPILVFSIFSLSYFLLRILIENSFSIFSIDLCFVILCLNYLYKKNLKIS